jgi:hypothetical protein
MQGSFRLAEELLASEGMCDMELVWFVNSTSVPPLTVHNLSATCFGLSQPFSRTVTQSRGEVVSYNVAYIIKPNMHFQMYDQCLNVYDVTFISDLDLHFAFLCLMFDIGESMTSSMIYGTLYLCKCKGKCQPRTGHEGLEGR